MWARSSSRPSCEITNKHEACCTSPKVSWCNKCNSSALGEHAHKAPPPTSTMNEGETARGSFAVPGSKSDAASAEGDHVPKNIFLTGGAGEYFATCFAAHNLRFFFVMESFPLHLRCTHPPYAPMLTRATTFHPSFSSYSQVSLPRTLPSCFAKNIRSTMVNSSSSFILYSCAVWFTGYSY